MNPFTLIVGLTLAFVFMKTKNLFSNPVVNQNIDLSKVSTSVINKCSLISQKHFSEVRKVINNFNCSIPVNAVFACIYNESANHQHLNNSEIIGDNGRAMGFMQVTKNALPDVNEAYNLNITFNDLQSYETNIKAGILYLELSFKSAKREGSINPVKLSFKKYNGGIDENDKSLNLMAENYSVKAYNNFLIFNAIEGMS